MPARVRSGSPAVLLAFLMAASTLIPLLDSSSVQVSADSLSSWSKEFRMHEGLPSSASDYDWLNSSAPQNPDVLYLDYDADGNWGISIKKNLPSQRWRHFWALDPAVNGPVRIQGDIVAHIWAASLDNESGYVMTVRVSDIAPGQWTLPDDWATVGQATVPIQGPTYSAFKVYDLTIPSVDYVLQDGHRLVTTIMRSDGLPSGIVLIVYDNDMYDSHITVPLLDFVSVSDAWAEDPAGTPRDTFSDTEVITVKGNVSDPFGSYDIAGADCTVAYSSNGTVRVPRTAMAVSQVDPSANSSWKIFAHDIGPLAGGSYVVTVNGSDPEGSPTWLDFSISVILVDHFSVDAPEVVVAGSDFQMTVTALDALDVVIPNWRGTVYLDAFKADMVTPASGALSVQAIEFTGTEGGTLTITNQTYDHGEETILIKASSGSHTGWSGPITVFCGPVDSIMLDPGAAMSLTSDDPPVAFTVTAYDINGLVNSTWTPSWSVEGGIGTVEPSGFSATFYATSVGTGSVRCDDLVTGVYASVEVTVLPGFLDHIAVTPAGPLSMKEGQSVSLSAVGYDSGDNVVPLTNPVWYTNTSGLITGTGSSVTYTAGFIPEVGVITVSVGSVSASVSVTVTNPLNGPWLSTIPSQIVNEDSAWDLSLASYWNHVNGTTYLRWYAEGVDTSMYMVTHDASSAATVGFITQPDMYGTDTFRLWVRDPDGYSTYQDIVVSIQPVNDRPVFVHTPPTEFYVTFDTPYSFDFDYYVSDVDNDKDELSMASSSSGWGSIVFEGLISSFLFTEKDGTTSYFETMKITLTDAGSGVTPDSTNSAYLSIVVWITDDTPPSLNEDLPDVPDLLEGEMNRKVFDLDDYFFDVDEDFLVYKYGFQNIEVAINTTTHEVFMSAPYEWSGITDGTFTAVDEIGAFKTDTVTVTVIPVNDAPSVVSPMPVHVRYEVAYVLDAGLYVYDPDHSFSELAFTFTSPYASQSERDIILVFPANLSGGAYTDAYIVEVGMTVEDPEGASGTCEFMVTVSDNYPPALMSPVPYPDIVSFPEDTYLNGSLDMDILFTDVDDSALQYAVGFQSGEENLRATIYPDGSVNFTAAANWSGYEVVQFTAFDSHHAWISWSMTVVVTPVNDIPVMWPIDDLRLVGWPRSFQLLIGQYISDIETPYKDLVISVSPEAYVTAVGMYLYVSMPEDLDEISVTIYVVDADGASSNSVTFNIEIAKTTADVIGYPYTLPLVVLAAAVASYFIASRLPKPHSLENLFLIHNDGRLVAHVTRQENTSIDKDVVSAMFTAVQEFVRDSFQAGEVGLKKLEIGDKNVMIEKGKSVYLAMIYSGWPSKDTFTNMTMLLRDIEERFGERISHWNGTMRTVKGVEGMLQKFMSDEFKPGSWVSEEEIGEDEWVDILSKET